MRIYVAKFHEIWQHICVYIRFLDLASLSAKKSILLLGARQTGKSTLLRNAFPAARYIDLLEANTFRELSAAPEKLRLSLNSSDKTVIIDEIQKLPSLFDEVQSIIDRNPKIRFILTGSSARKLRRRNINLLPGRIWTQYLFPLVTKEIGLDRLGTLQTIGGLPGIVDSSYALRELREYVGIYLQEEIRAESLTRSIEAFSRFLNVAGLSNSQQLNFTKIGNDAEVPARTVREFFQVLEDTLVGYQLPPYKSDKKRKSVSTSKFYFFDIGIAHALQGIREIVPGTIQAGVAFEHLIANELRAYLSYTDSAQTLTYWRSLSQIEVDFVLGNSVAIEAKSGGKICDRDLKGLRALREEINLKRHIVVTSGAESYKTDDQIEIMPVDVFLHNLWEGKIFGQSV